MFSFNSLIEDPFSTLLLFKQGIPCTVFKLNTFSEFFVGDHRTVFYFSAFQLNKYICYNHTIVYLFLPFFQPALEYILKPFMYSTLD